MIVTPEELPTPINKKKRINSKQKGNNYERYLAQFFRKELNHPLCKTSRMASRLMDDCGIDLVMIPYLVSAKKGYMKNRPKPDEIFRNIRKKLLESFPSDDSIHRMPMFLFHMIDGYSKENHIVSMPFEHFAEIIKVYEKYRVKA